MRRRRYRQVIIRYVFFPAEGIDKERFLDVLYICLGFGDERDEVGKKVFRAVVKAGERGISSREILEKVDASQAAVIYHLNNLMRSGFIVKEGRYYFLKGRNVEETLHSMEEELISRMEKLRKIAKMLEL